MKHRKWLKTVIVFLVCTIIALLVWNLTDCAVLVDDNQTAEISYDDSQRLRKLLSVEKIHGGPLRCMFSEDFCVKMGGLTYCPAQDDCNSVYVKELDLYYSITDTNHEKLHELLSSYM